MLNKELVGLLKKTSVLVWATLLLIIINMLQFAPINSSTNYITRAIYRNDTTDITELTLRLSNVNNTHNVFVELGNFAPGTNLLVPKKHPFRSGSTFHDRLVGLGKVENITIVSLEIEELLESIDLSKFSDSLAEEGEVWEQPGHPRLGRPGYLWEIYINEPEPEKMALIILEEEQTKWVFIDLSLLSREYYEGLLQ